jgi:hypothetical protein
MPGNDLQPWEQAGAVRRDCVSHRGRWLVVLGIAALLCSIAFPPAGLALGVLTWLAKRDLAQMDAGLMDPDGRAATSDAVQFGRDGVVLACVFLPLFLCLVLGVAALLRP